MNTMTRSNKFDERELTITRVFDAPRALVFKVWTDPKHLAQWWGPQGFTNPVCEFDARVGGELRIHMRGPDGAIYPMKGVIREFAPPERLAFTSIAIDAAGNHLLEGMTTVLFDEGTARPSSPCTPKWPRWLRGRTPICKAWRWVGPRASISSRLTSGRSPDPSPALPEGINWRDGCGCFWPAGLSSAIRTSR
jgi:uncharacterized protein YndB with AHSA1/START domain